MLNPNSLPDAMLICDNVQAFSDEYGQFEMEVEIGRKIVAVQLFGYEPTSAVVELNSAASGNSRSHD